MIRPMLKQVRSSCYVIRMTSFIRFPHFSCVTLKTEGSLYHVYEARHYQHDDSNATLADGSKNNHSKSGQQKEQQYDQVDKEYPVPGRRKGIDEITHNIS